MRKLATIRQVSNIRPIEGKDLIEQINIDGWNVIVKKGEFQEGDLCVYVEIDSLLPAKPEFEFLEKKKYIIKTMKMAGVRSEGIVFPLSILPKRHKVKLGDDVTKVLGVKQYNKETEVPVSMFTKVFDFIDRQLRRNRWYRLLVVRKRPRTGASSFPGWIRKTDEERIQNKKWVLNSDTLWVATEKLDGSSATFGYRKGKTENDSEYVVCSRNQQVYDKTSIWHRISNRYAMECVLKGLFTILKAQHSIVIQGEIIGPKIQKNKYNLTDIDFYAFNLIIDGKNTSIHDIEAKIVSNDLELKKVPVMFSMSLVGKEVDEILDMATFKSNINGTTQAEGLVFRTFDEDDNVLDSFKAISPLFLIKNDE